MLTYFWNAAIKRIRLGVCLAVVLTVWCYPTAAWGQLDLAPQVRVMAHSPNLIAGHVLGYWPVVCVIENGSDRRYEIEVRCPETATYRHVNWRALRKVTVEPQSTARITLWLPPPAFAELALEFLVNGRPVDNTLRFSSLSGRGFTLAHTPRVLASNDAARFARGLVFGGRSDWILGSFTRERQVRFELTEQPQQMYASSAGLYGGPWVATMPALSTGSVGIGPEAFTQRELALCIWNAPVRDWDSHWISYSPFQGMVLTPKDWWEAPAEVQEAIIRWVTLGGALLFLDVHSAAQSKKPAPADTSSIPPQAALMLDDFAPGDDAVLKTALVRRQEILSSFPATDAPAAVLAADKAKKGESDGQNGRKPQQLPELLQLVQAWWDSYLPCGFGEVHYVLVQTHQPTPLAPNPSAQVMVTGIMSNKVLVGWGASVSHRYLVAVELFGSEYARDGLLKQAFQRVRGIGVPVLGFFVILLLFSVFIGPVTLGILGRLKRRIWLIWVVPVIALTGSLVIFLYGFLAEGVSAHIGVCALTVLDERHHRASTLGVLAFYSPITPPGGIQLDYDTEPTFLGVTAGYDPYDRYSPYGPYGRPYRSRQAGQQRQTVVDWSEKQHLVSGWLMPRVTEYATVRRCEVRRERLTLRREAGRLFAANGLGCGVRKLQLCDHDGKWWSADYLPAGQEIELRPCDPPAEYQSLKVAPTLWQKLMPLVPPPGDMINPSDERIGPPSDVIVTNPPAKPPLSLAIFLPGALHNWLLLGSGSSGLRHWSAELLAEDGPKPHHLLCPGRYLAELEESRFLTPGLRWVKSREERCWVLGIFDPPR